MANDLHALEDVETGRADVIVRCYGWNQNALTIGRLQDETTVTYEMGDWPIYRRPTGGRAILHGDDLTISVAAMIGAGASNSGPIETGLIKRGVLSDYFCVTEPIRLALADHGITADYGKDTVQCNRERNRQSADCFKINALCDIVDSRTGNKIVGSAMRRGRRAFMVQSSLKKQVGINHFSDDFLHSLQTHLARYLSIEHWDFPYR
jgi:lipoate-protein ligase A